MRLACYCQQLAKYLHIGNDDEDKIYGWMEIEDNGQLQPFDESNKDKILQQYIYQPSFGIFRRLFRSNKNNDSK